jgi:hypothetical protein
MRDLNPITPIRLSDEDRASLREIVKNLGMSQSFFIRAVIRESIAVIQEQNAAQAPALGVGGRYKSRIDSLPRDGMPPNVEIRSMSRPRK